MSANLVKKRDDGSPKNTRTCPLVLQSSAQPSPSLSHATDTIHSSIELPGFRHTG